MDNILAIFWILTTKTDKKAKNKQEFDVFCSLECSEPLGMENGFIPDYTITASTQVRDINTCTVVSYFIRFFRWD